MDARGTQSNKRIYVLRRRNHVNINRIDNSNVNEEPPKRPHIELGYGKAIRRKVDLYFIKLYITKATRRADQIQKWGCPESPTA